MNMLEKGLVFGAAVGLFGCASRTVPPSAKPWAMSTQAANVYTYSEQGAEGLAGDDEADSSQAWGIKPKKRKPKAAPAGWSLPNVFGGLALPKSLPSLPWLFPSPGPAQPNGGQKAPPVSIGAPRAVAFAQAQLGKPYCWGGSGPSCFDCSGLTSQSWKAGGKTIPRTSEAQVEQLPGVPLDQALPGDILWRPGHVALYVGGGQIIHAPHTGDVVKYAPAVRFVKAVRP